VKLTVIIPCYNERNTVREVVRRVLAQPGDKEVILVDDGSTDGSHEIIRDELAPLVDKVIYHDRNIGKGASVVSGLRHATGDVVIIQDADLEYDPSEYERLIKPLAEGHADAVYGSRFAAGDEHRVLFFWHSMGNRFLTFVSNAFTNLNLTDMETCYKAFRAETIKGLTLREKRFGFEPEVTAKLARQGARIYEVGISYHGRTYAEGKKITWADGLRALWCIIRYNLFG